MTNRHSNNWIYEGVIYLAEGLIYAAVLMRSFLLYRETLVLGQVLGLLVLWLGLFLAGMVFARHNAIWFHLYLVVQTLLTILLIYGPEFKEYDYFSLLFAILAMQVMRELKFKAGLFWILAFILLIGYPFFRNEGPMEGLTRLLLFGSIIVFLASYSWAARCAQEARTDNQTLMLKLQDVNQQLQSYADTQKQLSVVRERQRMARELHDSVTQTIFSMTLTTQSALLLSDKGPGRVAGQLERLNQLAQSALNEIHTLITELRPMQVVGDGLVMALRQHINNRHLPEGLSVNFDVDGERALLPIENQGLFRIVQEALNNIVKHAHATKVSLHLHLEDPLWIEIDDDGQGFNLNQPQAVGKVGLAGMRERAEEIRWNFTIQTASGEGTHIRVEKVYAGEGRI